MFSSYLQMVNFDFEYEQLFVSVILKLVYGICFTCFDTDEVTLYKGDPKSMFGCDASKIVSLCLPSTEYFCQQLINPLTITSIIGVMLTPHWLEMSNENLWLMNLIRLAIIFCEHRLLEWIKQGLKTLRWRANLWILKIVKKKEKKKEKKKNFESKTVKQNKQTKKQKTKTNNNNKTNKQTNKKQTNKTKTKNKQKQKQKIKQNLRFLSFFLNQKRYFFPSLHLRPYNWFILGNSQWKTGNNFLRLPCLLYGVSIHGACRIPICPYAQKS